MEGKITKELQERMLKAIDQEGKLEEYEPAPKIVWGGWVHGRFTVKVQKILPPGFTGELAEIMIQLTGKDIPLIEYGPFTVEENGTVTLDGVEVRMGIKLEAL